MKEYISKVESEKNSIKLCLFLLHAISLIVIFGMGTMLYRLVPKYLNNISILNTFFILVFLYIFQLLVEGLRFFILYIRNFRNDRIYIRKIFKSRFLIINFGLFIFSLAFIFIFSLFSLFFSPVKVFFMICCGVALSVIYLIYTIEILKLLDGDFSKYKFSALKNNIYDFTILVLLDTIMIIFSMSIFEIIQRHYILIVAGIVLLSLILYSFNRFYIKNKIMVR